MLNFSFKTKFEQAVTGLKGLEKTWFVNYLGIIAYEKSHKGGAVSEIFSSHDRSAFEDSIAVSFLKNFATIGVCLDSTF